MSQAYDMYVQIERFQPKHCKAIKRAAQEIWNFDWIDDSEKLLTGCGESQLAGGEGEEAFAHRLAKAIWAANGGGYCQVLVRATCLEDLPYEDYLLDEEDWLRLTQDHPGAIR